MPEFSNPTSLAIAVTAIIAFAIGIVAFLFLLGVLAANRNILSSMGRSADETRHLKRAIINFALLFAIGALVGTITLLIAYTNEKEQIFVVATLLIAGALVFVESVVLFLLFLGRIVLTATPQKPAYGAGKGVVVEQAKQVGVILGGALVSGFLLHLVYDANISFTEFSPAIEGRDLVKAITLIASYLSLLTGLSALFIILVLALIGDRQHRINPLWVVLVVGIVVGGSLLYISQLLS